jgi:Rad3-related DNA helicase
MSTIKQDINRYTSRVEQDNAIAYIKRVLEKKPDNKFFLMNLPTGSGKSHLAMMISDYYSSAVNKTAGIDVVTPSKLLQDQYSDEYKSINNLKGINNYKCKEYECSCASGKEFNKLNKTKCEECPYDFAKVAYNIGKLSMTNFHLYLIYALFGKESKTREPKLLIVDEAHELDDVMTDFISMKVTDNSIKKMKLRNDAQIFSALKAVNNIESYVTFIELLREEAICTIDMLNNSMQGNRDVIADKRNLTIIGVIGGENEDITTIKLRKELEQICTKIEIFTTEYSKDPNNWVLESNYNEKTNLGFVNGPGP